MNQQALSRFVVRARHAVKLHGTVSVLITSNTEMRKLNLYFRNKNKATDVLSFPAGVSPGSDIAGDVAISAEIARENAKNLGHSIFDEIKILILHGILHLAGYDHETDGGQMATQEHRLRNVLHLPVTLIERSAAEPQRSRKRAFAAGKKPQSPVGSTRKTGKKRRS